MNDAPLDIVVPFWGDPGLLRLTVESVRAQDDPGWRLTVVDDCYPDPAVAAWFDTIDDERIRYLRNDTNLGITANYRRALEEVGGDHVVFLGCDDLLLPRYVRVVRAALAAHPDVDAVQPGVRVVDDEGTVITPLVDRVKALLAPRAAVVLDGEGLATSMIRGAWFYWPSLCFRTATVRTIGFREGLPIIQDLALIMDIAFRGGSLAFEPEVVFEYRRHPGSASQKTVLDGRRFTDERRYYAMAADEAERAGFVGTRRAARARIISRLHAASEILPVIARGTPAGRRAALAHVFGRTPASGR